MKFPGLPQLSAAILNITFHSVESTKSVPENSSKIIGRISVHRRVAKSERIRLPRFVYHLRQQALQPATARTWRVSLAIPKMFILGMSANQQEEALFLSPLEAICFHFSLHNLPFPDSGQLFQSPESPERTKTSTLTVWRFSVRSDFRSASGGELLTRNHAIPLTGTLYLSKYYSSLNLEDIRSDKYFSLSWKNRQRTNGELQDEDIVICFITGNFTIWPYREAGCRLSALSVAEMDCRIRKRR